MEKQELKAPNIWKGEKRRVIKEVQELEKKCSKYSTVFRISKVGQNYLEDNKAQVIDR